MTIDLTQIIEAIIALLAALITYRLVPWIKARTTDAQQKNIATAIEVFVFAAEQIYGSGKGHEKLAYVRRKLNESGFEVDVAQIEACVYSYMGHDEKPPEEIEEITE